MAGERRHPVWDSDQETDRDWRFAFDAVVAWFPRQVFELSIVSRRGRVTMRGSIGSIAARTFLVDLVGCQPGVVGIRNLVEVTAPLFPATRQRDEWAESTRASALRYPAVEVGNVVEAGLPLSVLVDLALEPDGSTTAPVIAFDVPGDWTDLDVDVEVASAQLRFEPGAHRGTVQVIRDGPSIPARVRGTVADGVSHVHVTVLFEHAGRFCGMIRRSFEVDCPAATPDQAPMPATPRGMSIVAEPERPLLMVKVIKPRSGDGLVWSFTAPSRFGKGRTSGTTELPDPRGFADTLMKACPTLVSGQHCMHLRGVGESIWRATPDEFKDLYLALRAEYGTAFAIQIVTDEHYVPWEMMWPREAPDGGDHLFMTHPIARWLGDRENDLVATLPAGRIVTFVPDYGAARALTGGAAERDWMVSTFDAVAPVATFEAFTSLLRDGLPNETVSIVHFAGHGVLQGDSGHGGIRLVDGWVTVDAVSHGGIGLGSRDRSLVVLNACETGAGAVRLGAVEGWPAALAANQFGAVLAPVWAVEDHHASAFVRTAISRYMIQGDTLAAAVLHARKEGREVSATAYAYALHGDVMARRAD